MAPGAAMESFCRASPMAAVVYASMEAAGTRWSSYSGKCGRRRDQLVDVAIWATAKVIAAIGSDGWCKNAASAAGAASCAAIRGSGDSGDFDRIDSLEAACCCLERVSKHRSNQLCGALGQDREWVDPVPRRPECRVGGNGDQRGAVLAKWMGRGDCCMAAGKLGQLRRALRESTDRGRAHRATIAQRPSSTERRTRSLPPRFARQHGGKDQRRVRAVAAVRFGLPGGRKRPGELFVIERGRLLEAGKVAGERSLQRRVVGLQQRAVGLNTGPQLVRINDRKAFERRASASPRAPRADSRAHVAATPPALGPNSRRTWREITCGCEAAVMQAS